MSANRDREEEIFDAARELAAHERAAYLANVCGQDADLRQRIEGMLESDAAAGEFFKTHDVPAPTAVLADASLSPSIEKAGDRIGRYKLLQQIGEGGCGIVYMAEQEEPVRRRVALKVIKLGMDTKQVIARFEAERQALALMDHPNIAKVLDAGATDTGRPYFVMELVPGPRITEFCDENKLSTEDRLNLFMLVCQAIQHAHQKGVIHRDIKPSNILVTVNDGVPVPKVIDFGIAKATAGRLTDQTLFTAFEQFIGTPAYMSPEQAVLTSLDIDTRSDIYSLGVLLYELLTGSPPFDQKELLAAGLDEMRRIIRETEPPRPSNRLSTMAAAALTVTAHHRHTEPPRLVHLVRGDLDWIAMKCLEKDRARRYETANGLAADIQRHLSCQPVVARPPSRLYEFQKTVRRHKFGFAAAGAVILALAVGLGISTWTLVKEKQARERAVAAEREQTRLRQLAEDARIHAEANEQKAESAAANSAQVAQFMKDMLGGVGPAVALGRDTAMLREILDKTVKRLGEGLANQPAVEAELRTTIGDVYYAIGDYTKAEAMHREALAIRTKLWGSEHLDVARSLSGLGLALWKGGKPAESETLLRRSLETRTRILGDEHPEIARCLCELAEVLRFNDKGSEAVVLHRKSLAMRRRLHGDERLEVADSLNRLGSLLSSRRNDEDERLLRESLAIRKKLLGSEHPDVAEALDNLAHSLHRRNKLVESEPMHREALAMRRKYFGREHAEIALSLLNLGHVLKQQNKLTEAEAMYREALAMQSTLLGYDSRRRALNELINLLQIQGRLAEAEALTRKQVSAAQEQFGDVHREVDLALSGLARTLELQGKFVEAEAVWREELALERKLSGEKHAFIANSLESLAFPLFAQNKLSEAEETRRQALAMRRSLAFEAAESSDLRVLEKASWWLATGPDAAFRDGPRALQIAEKGVLATSRKDPNLLDNLAAAHAEMGNFEMAVSIQKEAMALVTEKVQQDEQDDFASHLKGYLANRPFRESTYKSKLDIANSLEAVVFSLLGQGKAAEAEKPVRACLAIREHVAPEDWQTFNSRSLLGGSLLGQKKYAEAEPFLLSAFEGMQQREQSIPAVGKVRIPEALHRLVQLYEATGQPEKAAEWKKRLAEFNQTKAKK